MSESSVENHRNACPAPSQADERVFLWGATILAAAVFVSVALLAGFRLPNRAGHSSMPEGRRLIEFSLTERSGRTVTRDDARGKFLVVNFVHTGCSVSCALVNRQMARIQRLVEGQSDVQLLSVSVDPDSDTPSALGRFGEQFGADRERWWFLTGRKSAVYQFLETSFLERDTNSAYPMTPGGFRKADHIAVVDRDGYLRQLIQGTRIGTPETVVEILAQLRSAPGGH